MRNCHHLVIGGHGLFWVGVVRVKREQERNGCQAWRLVLHLL